MTAPGTGVTVGPGGANVTVDPEKAIGDVTGGKPPTGPGTGSGPGGKPGSSTPHGSNAGGTAPHRGGSARPGGSAPSRGRPSTNTGKVQPGGGGSTGRQARPGTTGSGQTSSSGGGSSNGSTPKVELAREAAQRNAPTRGVLSQVFEKVRTELLVALLALALIAAAMSLVWLRERGRVRKVQRQAEVDPLTGIPNRLAFENRLAEEWRRARRYDRPLGLLLLDIDGLKRVNDSNGHEAGDRLIRSAAQQIAENIRESDTGARLAGDEFVVLCPETARHGVEHLGAKLTERLHAGGIAASIGWAQLVDSDVAPGDLLARADAAMYQQKAERQSAGTAPTGRPGLAIAS